MAGRGTRENESGFRVKKVVPEIPPAAVIAQAQLDAIRGLQIAELADQGVDLVEIDIPHDRPVMVVTLGDLHVGSTATDHDKMLEIRDMILAQPDICVVLLGDEIEGMKAPYLDTNTARTPIDVRQQIELLREVFLGPLAKAGRVLGMVVGYWGHPGWAQDSSTINPWKDMVQGYDIPLINNGGQIKLTFKNGHEQSLRIFHNPPGKSNDDRVFGLRKALVYESLPDRPNVATGAHLHRAGIAKEYSPNDTNTDTAPQATVMVQSGTIKGSNPLLPSDRFGTKLGAPPTDTVGQGVIFTPRKKRNGRKLEQNYPFATYEHGLLAFSALQLLNNLEAQGITAEMMEKIHSEVEARPNITFNKRKSQRVSVPYDESPEPSTNGTIYDRWHEDLSPQYSRAHYDVVTQLPIAVELVQNVRAGSNSEGLKALQHYFADRLQNNPHALVALLRNMVDQEVAGDSKRIEVLDKIVALGVQYPQQILAIMHDGNLRQEAWKSSTGKEAGQGPVPAGTYLSDRMKAPLIAHHSTLELSVGPKVFSALRPNYTMLTLDGLDKHGSQYRPTFGHGRVYDLYTQTKPGIVVGGHMPSSGFSVRPDASNSETPVPVFVAPGWWAATADAQGKRNTRPGSMPGQSVILMPGANVADYMVFPTANPEETKYMHEALLLWQGLQVLGLTKSVIAQK